MLFNFNILRDIKTGNILGRILHLMDTAFFEKTQKHNPRTITGTLTRSEDGDTHSMRVL